MLNNTSTLNASAQSNAYDFSEFTKLKKESKDHSPEALKQVAKQFEALFLNNILKKLIFLIRIVFIDLYKVTFFG